jgi:hypothetical protein
MELGKELCFKMYSYVVCCHTGQFNDGVERKPSLKLTLGKKYKVLNEDHQDDVGVKVINDDGEECFYNIKRFRSISYHRDKCITEILNNAAN